ncbi:MAG TPA: NapC/NirT family cytochrome c [Candidatus Kapabacteria bacterium]|jgi:nitrate/TMAO reductase-like tetraheme cytochrome c subunit|nr:NapC/NirT family cytochrome c [Candidatus Kapabacteria bacterium]
MADAAQRAGEPQTPHGKRPSLLRNGTSLIGIAIALAALVAILFLVLAEMLGPATSPYMGILTYIVFPTILVIGLLVMFIGAQRERRRRHRLQLSGEVPYPRIDLNSASTRRQLYTFSALSVIFLTISAVGSYHAFEYTESIEFCGQVCHEVMNPEFVAYQSSPHARVRCVDCHVGPGAGWYVRSKLSGAYQVYAATFNLYPKPIPTPVANLRPAQHTCEQCHWPAKFFGAQLKEFNRFGYDEANTPRHTRMLIKTGGGSAEGGQVQGIHWHMNIANEISYVSTDDQRQRIPWVRMKSKDGKVEEYFLQGMPDKLGDLAKRPLRTMDCIDCHNRPSHIYNPPDLSVDKALFAGRIDKSLPFVKRQSVMLLAAAYPSTDAALRAIAGGFNSFYQKNHPDVFASQRPAIQRSIAELQKIYATNFFPEMKTDFRTHPNNAGHYYNQGCFRCHDGKHVSKSGKVISAECNICHETLDQQEGPKQVAITAGSYEHPLDFFGGLSNHACTDCHTGQGATFPRFKHTEGVDVAGMECIDCHAPAAAPDTAATAMR